MSEWRVLDLFSGIGGFSLGLERAGMRTVAFCEIEEYPRAVLKKHWPNISCYEDVRTLTAERLRTDGIIPNIICGGFLCQGVSEAGLRQGLQDPRSGLWQEYARIIGEVRPLYVIVENVSELLRDGYGMGEILADLAKIGFDAEWDCISVGELGAPHGRDRVWIAIADPHQFQRSKRVCSGTGWWKWRPEEIETTRNANGQWKLEPARLLGNVRRWVDDAANSGTWWRDQWQEKFEALRRMDDGSPTRLDRSVISASLKCLGNALAPQIPEIWGRAIIAHHEAMRNAT